MTSGLAPARASRIADIVAVLYASVHVDLHKAAGRSVFAHLRKLVDDGRVRVDDDTPSITSHFKPVGEATPNT